MSETIEKKIRKIMQKFDFVLCIVDNLNFLIAPGLSTWQENNVKRI